LKNTQALTFVKSKPILIINLPRDAMQSVVLLRQVVLPFFCEVRYRDHIGWNTSKKSHGWLA